MYRVLEVTLYFYKDFLKAVARELAAIEAS